jgi:ABC-type glutathione transport system ATPase component
VEAILEVRDLAVRFAAKRGRMAVDALAGVTVAVEPAQCLGVVGESGSGKTTLAHCMAGLRVPTRGSVLYRGEPVRWRKGRSDLPRVRGVQVIYQDPGASLNPRRTIESVLVEILRVHRMCTRAEEEDRLTRLLGEVGLDRDLGSRRPDRLSGGQQQRAAIARALAFSPAVLVADEAVSSLDASVQAQVLNLLSDLRDHRALAMVFVTHDMAVARQMCDRLAIMHEGEVAESGPTERLFEAPSHPYTRELLAAVPRLEHAGAARAGEEAPACA